MITDETLLEWQRSQYEHDMRNHFDILCLHKQDRVKHYALHFGKYAGRLARGEYEEKSTERTLSDSLLVCLSTANTLHQRLVRSASQSNASFLIRITDAQGRLCDAAEKIDHLEPFVEQAKCANQDILNALLDFAASITFDLDSSIRERRAELGARHFYIR